MRIKNKLKRFAIVIAVAVGVFGLNSAPALAACGNQGARFVLGIPTWYKYLPNSGGLSAATGKCVPAINSVDDFLLIGLAVVEILLRIATYIAIGAFIFGAIMMITSQGSPEGVKKARDTITNSVVGLVITLVATVVVNFVGRALG